MKTGQTLNRRVSTVLPVAALLVIFLAAATARADYTMAKAPDNSALVLIGGNSGTGTTTTGQAFDPGTLYVTTIGGTDYLVVVDTTKYRQDVYVLDATQTSANANQVSAQVGVFNTSDNFWGLETDLYVGAVNGPANAGSVALTTGSSLSGLGHAGITGLTAGGSFFALGNSTYNQTRVSEVRLENSSGQLSASAGTVAELSYKTSNGLWTTATSVGSSGDTFQVLILDGYYQTFKKYEIGAQTGSPAAGTYGSRTFTTGGQLTTRSVLEANLVPGIADEIAAMSYNPADGNLYFLSNFNGDIGDGNGVTDHVFLSAASFNWGTSLSSSDGSVTFDVDLDSSADGTQTYIEITYHAYTPGGEVSSLLTGGGLAFNADGSVLYVSNSNKGGSYNEYLDYDTGDAVFVFTTGAANAPEPATLALLGLGVGGLLVRRLRRR